MPGSWLDFCWPWEAPVQLGEAPGPALGRQADSAGWLAHAHCPAEMASGEEWVLPLHFFSLSWAILSSPSLRGQASWALLAAVGESPAGSVPRAIGYYDSLLFLPLKPLDYPASVVSFQGSENIAPHIPYTCCCLRLYPSTFAHSFIHFILAFVVDKEAKGFCH